MWLTPPSAVTGSSAVVANQVLQQTAHAIAGFQDSNVKPA